MLLALVLACGKGTSGESGGGEASAYTPTAGTVLEYAPEGAMQAVYGDDTAAASPAPVSILRISVLEATWERVSAFGDGLAAAKDGKLWGYVDKSGKWLITPRYSYARPFWNGLAAVTDGGRSLWIDRRGSIVWPAQP